MDAKKLFLQYSNFVILHFIFCSGKDSINSSQIIKDGDLLISQGNNFALGFFSPGSSSNRYLGIWYHKVPRQTVVWVANRNHPISDSSGVLAFDQHGNLVLFSDLNQNILVWSTDVILAEVLKDRTACAQLSDSGNFVLVLEPSRTIIWQSFDYPTDNFLPGMKLGLDRVTGIDVSLTSWRSADDPGIGSYSYKINSSGSPQFFLYKGAQLTWRTAPWPWRWNTSLYNYSFVNNHHGTYSVYSVLDDSVLLRAVLDYQGLLKVVTWHENYGKWIDFFKAPHSRCDPYGQCGAFSTCGPTALRTFECDCLPGYEPKNPREWFMRHGSGGCVRKRLDSSPVCGQGEGFVKVENVLVPDASTAVWVDMNISRADCELECKRNCSCSAYASINITDEGYGCLAWYGQLMGTTYDRSEAYDLYVRVDAIELAENARKSNDSAEKEMTTILVLVISSVWFVISLLGYLWLRKKGKTGTLEAYSRTADFEYFKLSTISAATNNFSPANKLGRGGFGTVYKCQLLSGQVVAVKRLSTNSGQGLEEFKNEVTVIAKLQHRNLVKLLGCCIQGGEKMLIYEYLPNRSLDSFLFAETRDSFLDWRKRFNIIVGIARGLLYLHQDSRLRIIHRDLKCSNILLDSEMNPKISDFGTARIFQTDQFQDKTNRVVGTYGYMSPEYAVFGKFSVKSDVFSIGVMLLEIVSGKRNNKFSPLDPSLTLIGHVWKLFTEDKTLETVDSSLEEIYDAQEVLRCIQIGLLCVQEDPMDRPSMLAVVSMLSSDNEAAIFPSPKQPAFVFRKHRDDAHIELDIEERCSVNEVTITAIVSR